MKKNQHIGSNIFTFSYTKFVSTLNKTGISWNEGYHLSQNNFVRACSWPVPSVSSVILLSSLLSSAAGCYAELTDFRVTCAIKGKQRRKNNRSQ